MVRWAAENDFDRITWTTGEMQFVRYGSEEIVWQRRADGAWDVRATEQVGGRAEGIADIGAEARLRGILQEESSVVSTEAELHAMIDSVLSRSSGSTEKVTKRVWKRMQTEDIGTSLPRKEGMEAAYDVRWPNISGKLGKKFGAKVETVEIRTSELTPEMEREPSDFTPVHSLPIPASMSASVMDEGFPRFAIRPGRRLRELREKEEKRRQMLGRGDDDSAQDSAEPPVDEPTASQPKIPEEPLDDRVERVFGVRNSLMDAEMERLGFDPAQSAEKRTFEEENDRAAAIIKANPDAAQELLASITANERPLDPTETAILTREITRQSLKRDGLEARIIKAGEMGDLDLVEALETQARKASADFSAYADALKRAGTKSGQSLAFRAMALREDYSLAALERKVRAANRGAQLTPEQQAEVRETATKLKELQAQLEALEASTDERVAGMQRQIDKLIAGSKRKPAAPTVPGQPRKRAPSTPGPVLDYISKRAAEARERIRARGPTMFAGVDPVAFADWTIIGVEYLAKDVRDLAAWSKAMVLDLGDAIKPHLDAVFKQAHDALLSMTAEAERDAAKRRIANRVQETGDFGTSVVQVRSMAEALVRDGITERDALIDAVHAILKEIEPSVTRRQTMDLISGYGEFKELSKDEAKTRLRELKGEMQQLAKIDDMTTKGTLPSKTGVERQALTDEGRRFSQRVAQLKRELGLTATDPARQLQSAMASAETRLRHQINDLEAQIEKREKRARVKADPLTSPVLDALRAERDALREILAQVVGVEQRPGHEQVIRARAVERALEKSLADYEKRIAAGTTAKPEREQRGIITPEMSVLRARRDALKAELEAMRKADGTLNEFALAAHKARMTSEIARLSDKISRNDFSPRAKPKPLVLDDEAAKLRGQLQKTKANFERKRAADRRERRNIKQKTADAVLETLGLYRAIKSSYDLSALGRQAKWLAAANPLMAIRAMKVSIKAMASEDVFQQVDATLRADSRPGLELTSLDEGLTKREEDVRSLWSDNLGMRPSNRAFTTLLNVMRVKIYDSMRAELGLSETLDRLKTIGRYASIATGRGDPGKFAAAAASAAHVLWAPRLYLSRIQLMIGQPLWDKGTDKVTRKLIAKQYGRSVVGLIGWYAALHMFMSSLLGDDDNEVTIEDDPRSADFGKVRVGNTRIDPMGGMLQFAVLASRLATQETKTLNGKIRSLLHDESSGKDAVGFGRDDAASVLGRFARTKLTPALGLGVDLLSGENVVGEPVTPKKPIDLAVQLLSPLAVQGAYEAVQEHGWPRGMALGALEMLGEGVMIYGDRNTQTRGKL